MLASLVSLVHSLCLVFQCYTQVVLFKQNICKTGGLFVFKAFVNKGFRNVFLPKKKKKNQTNANQNYNEIMPHICQNGHHQNSTNSKTLARKWGKGNPSEGTASQNVHWCSQLRKTVRRVLRRRKTGVPCGPAILDLGIYLKKKKKTD